MGGPNHLAPEPERGTPEPTRRESRRDVVRRVEYSPFPRRSAEAVERIGFTRDISPSGLCVRADEAEPTGSLLRLVLRDVDGLPTLESLARVAWRRANADGGWWLGLTLQDRRPIPIRRLDPAARSHSQERGLLDSGRPRRGR